MLLILKKFGNRFSKDVVDMLLPISLQDYNSLQYGEDEEEEERASKRTCNL